MSSGTRHDDILCLIFNFPTVLKLWQHLQFFFFFNKCKDNSLFSEKETIISEKEAIKGRQFTYCLHYFSLLKLERKMFGPSPVH